MSYNWTTDYLKLSTMIQDGQDPRDKEEPILDPSEDFDFRPIESMDTQSVTSTMSLESHNQPQPTVTDYSPPEGQALLANIDALSSLQGVASLLQQVNIAETTHQQPLPFNMPMPTPVQFPGAAYLPPPTQPAFRNPFSTNVQQPHYRDLWRSTLTEQTPDFSVFDPNSKLPEIQPDYQEAVFDPDNAVIEDQYCVLCRKNGEQREFYVSHVLKDNRGKVVCPILRKYVCPTCGATGDNAHTIRHCPKSAKRSSTEDSSHQQQSNFRRH